MSARRLLALALALSLLCAGCGRDGAEAETPQYAVWFLAAEAGADDAALGREYRALPGGAGEVEGLLSLLLAGPEDPDLRSPFPEGAALRSASVAGGLATVDLSEAYGGLSGAELTLADGCIVLTLCQLEGVDRVYLTVEGAPRPFRDLVLSESDFLLDNRLEGET